MPRDSMRGMRYRSFYPIQTIEISQGLSPQIEAEAMIRAVNSQYKAHNIPIADKSPLVEGVQQTLKGLDVDYSPPPQDKKMKRAATMLLSTMVPGMQGVALSGMMNKVKSPSGSMGSSHGPSSSSPPYDFSRDFSYQ